MIAAAIREKASPTDFRSALKHRCVLVCTISPRVVMSDRKRLRNYWVSIREKDITHSLPFMPDGMNGLQLELLYIISLITDSHEKGAIDM